MPNLLYLDTARLGQMSPGAQHAYFDFIRFAGDAGGSLYFEQFLRDGIATLPNGVCDELSGLKNWQGVAALKRRLQTYVHARPDSRVLLANRSSQLMKLAARLLFGPCRNVLVTDLSWPAYAKILEQNRGSEANRVTCLPLRHRILSNKITDDEVVRLVLEAYEQRKCDGLFLPAIDNLGVRFPVEQCVRAISARRELRFVVVDGAQAIGHVPVSLSNDFCDFFIAGVHKWLRAFHPTGLGFFGHPRSAAYIEERLASLIRCAEIDDPLLVFTEQAAAESINPFGETVNLGPLFSCHGALRDAEMRDAFPNVDAPSSNVNAVCQLALRSGWQPIQPHDSLQSRILLLRPPTMTDRSTVAHEMRNAFLQSGVALTTYDNGIVRISLPEQPWTSEQVERLSRAIATNGAKSKIRTSLATAR